MSINAQLCADRLGWALRSDVANERHASLRLAADFGHSKKAADNWVYGVNCPPVHVVIALAARRPRVKAALLKMIEEIEAAENGLVETDQSLAGVNGRGSENGR